MSADFLEPRPPARHVDRRQHVALALGRDRQRLPRVQKIEDAIFQRVPFVFVKLGIVAGVAEVRRLNIVVFGGQPSEPGPSSKKMKPAKSICVLPLAIVIEALVSSYFGAALG